MVFAGFWGGFIQIGVGFILMPILNRVMGLDLVATNAHKAAFSDPRFPQLMAAEIGSLDLSVSILSNARPIAFGSEAEAIDALQPDVDGVILEADGPDGQSRRGLFLPQVWETVPKAEQFLRHLKAKAGLPQDYWDSSIRLWRYTTETFH